MISRFFLLALLMLSGLVQAQQYRWVDKDGRVQFTDTPPPAGAKDVRKTNTAPEQPAAAPLPFELARLQQDFPVTLYTSPACKEGCERARALLNGRGIPFNELFVWDRKTIDELKKASGGIEVPALLVGRSVQRGFEQGIYDSLLDSAGYPKAGLYPPRSQKAPEIPEGYIAPDGSTPGKPAPRAEKAEAPQKAGRYDPSGLKGTPQKPGPYGVPGETQ